MDKESHGYVVDLPSQKTFEERYNPTVTAQASSFQTLGLNLNLPNESGDDNETDQNCLLEKTKNPLHVFKPFSSNEEVECVPHPEVELPTVKLPSVEQLPRSSTWVFTDRNQLMTESDSIIGKRQLHYVDGDIVEIMSSEEEDSDEQEEDEEEPLNKHDDGNVGETSGSRSSCIITNFQDAFDERYCPRCFIFNCPTHEKFEPKIKPREDNPILFENEDDREPCCEHCFLKVRSMTEADQMSNNKGKNVLLDTNTETEDCAVVSNTNEWTPVEKLLYLDGVQLFGRNSCLIAKNIFWKLKTCSEVHNYMQEEDHQTTEEVDTQINKNITRRGDKMVCKKVKRKQYVLPPALKPLKKTSGKEEEKFPKHYTPCTCYPTCGDECTCLANGGKTCCEKYCGCLKNCKNRFGGCGCEKGQCLNRNCPCFAAKRECDPDICRNCSISCGDSYHGESETSENKQCKNMQFLLKQHKKILIAKSDVHGWGAFTRHALKQNEFIGEYTGELITHEEADARYSAYLFDLNDKYVIDAWRKGNKTRFLNHSENPNCYAKRVVVRGDHRIGIYALRDIEEGEELFLDYGPDLAKWYPAREEDKPKCGRPRGSGCPRGRTPGSGRPRGRTSSDT